MRIARTVRSLVFLLCLLSVSSYAVAGPLRVGLVLDKNGKSDKGFNAAALAGLEKAKKALKIQGDAVEANGDNGHEPLLRDFAKKGYDLIIAVGEPRAAAVKKVAAEFPNSKFAIVDAEVASPNVRSILFKEQEGSYLAGALAAMTSKSGTVGFLGGMNIPVIRRYQDGFEAGVKRVNAKMQILTQYMGSTSDAWSNAAKAEELADSEYDSGADIVYVVSGSANLGAFDAAEKKHKLAIGVSNQNWIKPGRILTSMRKRVDIAVLMTCQDVMTGGFTGEVKKYGLSDQAMDLVMDGNNASLVSRTALLKLDQMKGEIIAGKVKF